GPIVISMRLSPDRGSRHPSPVTGSPEKGKWVVEVSPQVHGSPFAWRPRTRLSACWYEVGSFSMSHALAVLTRQAGPPRSESARTHTAPAGLGASPGAGSES